VSVRDARRSEGRSSARTGGGSPDGGAQIPGADAVTYAADAYQVARQLRLGLLIAGDGGTDTVTCP
jgi:hypothetical protein